ncbi:MAG: MerR family transcriptional regulator [Calditrichaeota bacterium]|nr:MAG: MerR family transcriptional regulator [Calditrichota bacterium]MBL1205573.1 MerR family transcriptional regulator [Calditrichota bacterium]NOG45402.1 MerR family transcriptional regulator [Calditrichota bacterium]
MKELLFNIGEFSRMTGHTLKALRLYHEKGLLIPHRVDEFTNYRYYNSSNLDQARIISMLRSMDFSLVDIKTILENYDNDSDIITVLKNQKIKIDERISNLENITHRIDSIIQKEKPGKNNLFDGQFHVEEKTVPPMLIAGLRFKGAYPESAKYIGKLAANLRSNMCSPPFCLYYDGEYKENKADIEVCFQIKKDKKYSGINVRRTKKTKVLSLIHKGPYEELSRSYSKIIAEIKNQKRTMDLPIREIYLKAPGMVFKGNPQNYLTEIQICVRKNGDKNEDSV